MKIYLASGIIDDVIKKHGFYYLFSYHYFKKKLDQLKEIKWDKNIFIDSGAFMAENIINWLDGVWGYILKKSPDIKVHAFGMTNQDIIDRYPWHSIDSTSFDRAARFGIVTLFNELKNEIYTIHLDEWRRQQRCLGISDELLNDSKYIREQTVKIGINTFWTYQQKINNRNKDYSYLTAQNTLF